MEPGQRLFNFLSKSKLISHSIYKWSDEDFEEYHEFYAEREAAAIEEFGLKWKPVSETEPTAADSDEDGWYLGAKGGLPYITEEPKELCEFYISLKDLPPVPKPEENKRDFESWWDKEGSLIYKDAAKAMAKQIWQTAQQ